LLYVQKFGGSSVADAERINNVARRIAETYRKGNQVVAVLSAQGDTTDELIQKANEINPNPNKRELDMLMATGEQQSVALMAMALHRMGVSAISLTGQQMGLVTTSAHGSARIRRIDTERIYSELDRNNVVLAAGFQGVNRYGDITTLGRGASDLTAVALAAVLKADFCEKFTDEDGVYTADPRVVKNARKIAEISYDEMLELASLGAKVLAARSVELAKKYQVELVVRSSASDAQGTIVKEGAKMESTYISGLAVDKNVASISVIGIKNEPGMAYKIFSLLAKADIVVDIILQSIGRDATKDIAFTVSRNDLREAVGVLAGHKAALGFSGLTYDDTVVKLSVVGAGMASRPGVASMLFEALYAEGINIVMISTSEIKISVLIDERDADAAANAVHDRFFTGRAAIEAGR